MEHRKVVIIGSGPSGYTAAIYSARAQLSPILFEGFYSGISGGQLMTTTEVENYPGFPEGVTGPELMEKMRAQAERFGTKLIPEDVIKVDLHSRPFLITSSSMQVKADTLIISTGASAKRLDIPGTRDGELWQKGVSACAVCDGAMPIFRNRPIFVIGGGDSAMEEALFLTRYGSKIYIVHRRDEFRASKIMADRVLSHQKIEVLWNSVVESVEGDPIVSKVVVKNIQSAAVREYEASGLFFAVGHVPNTKFLDGQLDLDEAGYIKVLPGSTKSSIPGVYASGDVQDHVYRQAITAAGTGCMAALEAERDLMLLGIE
ncbi:MAG: thioredoxin-disulfide reductase [Chlamydia sp.]